MAMRQELAIDLSAALLANSPDLGFDVTAGDAGHGAASGNGSLHADEGRVRAGSEACPRHGGER